MKNGSTNRNLSLLSFSYEKERSNHTDSKVSNLRERINEPKIVEYSNELEELSVKSMERCSRFDECSASKCPLDILIDYRSELQDDPKCEISKATRHRYWESMPDEIRSTLTFEGYLESEYNRMKAARERWESLPEDKKQEIRERMRNARPR